MATPDGDLPAVIRLAVYGVFERDGAILLCRMRPANLGAGRRALPGGRTARRRCSTNVTPETR